MRKLFSVAVIASLLFASCSRVEPNYYGVLMENYGKAEKDDYTRVSGKVNDWGPGTQLFQVPAWEQRASFVDNEGKERVLHLKAADHTEFTANPLYSYSAIKDRVVDLVHQNSRLGSGEDFMRALENNVLEPRIYDIIKEESRKYITDTLMASGGSLLFEQRVQTIIARSFDSAGLKLLSFSSNLDFEDAVKDKIKARNESSSNISLLEQQLEEQKKKNELAKLKLEENVIVSQGLTETILRKQALDKWDGKLPSTWSGNALPFVKTVQ